MSLGKRFKAESPDLFKRIVNIGIVLGTIGGVLMLPIAAPLAIPTVVTASLVTAGGVAAAIAKLTVKDTRDIE